jgi:hypothetical protein
MTAAKNTFEMFPSLLFHGLALRVPVEELVTVVVEEFLLAGEF